ncbi:MAG: wax ester/triacylglycerol synthase family O-acyltransferase [Gammaproteobacteria bacterium]|nr:MAG: wax ester/triacylglycerol synthase family O-acyltransferase [Gammaproteobacteria bacterium]
MNGTRMKPLDAVWLMMESADTPMHVGVLATFHKPRNAPQHYLSRWAQQMRESHEAVPPWDCCLSGKRGVMLGSQLVEDQDFDLDYHFRHSALPSPGGERELGVIVSRLHSNALDSSRPLWEFHLIEGLSGNRFAFYVKIHHALVDNVNGIPMVLSWLSASAKQRNMPPLWAQSPHSGEHRDEDESDEDGFADPVEAIMSIGKAASGLLRNAFKRKADGSFLLPDGAPRSTLNRQINSQRRFATQQFEQQRIQRLADATDTTINVILSYLCGSSLRRFFKEYNALPEEPLIGAIPVSLQERSKRLPGNAIAGIRVALGTHIGDPLARLEAVKTSMQEVRKDRASLPDEAVTPYVLMRAAPIYASQMPGIGRLVPPLFNLGVSNTPGPEQPRYFNGARMEAIYPLGSLMQFSALSIDCVNYAGTLNVGFTGARDTLPHLQRLAVYMGKAVADLEQLVFDREGEGA